jgi:hypothetical protein
MVLCTLDAVAGVPEWDDDEHACTYNINVDIYDTNPSTYQETKEMGNPDHEVSKSFKLLPSYKLMFLRRVPNDAKGRRQIFGKFSPTKQKLSTAILAKKRSDTDARYAIQFWTFYAASPLINCALRANGVPRKFRRSKGSVTSLRANIRR